MCSLNQNNTFNPTTNTVEKYNGWKNYETWNVALWIGGTYDLCKIREEYALEDNATYKGFVELTGLEGSTPDGTIWLDENLDYISLDEFIREV